MFKAGRFFNDYRGDGWFVSASTKSGWWLLAFRWRWHLYFIRPPGKPHVWRLYVGPFELERTNINARCQSCGDIIEKGECECTVPRPDEPAPPNVKVAP